MNKMSKILILLLLSFQVLASTGGSKGDLTKDPKIEEFHPTEFLHSKLKEARQLITSDRADLKQAGLNKILKELSEEKFIKRIFHEKDETSRLVILIALAHCMNYHQWEIAEVIGEYIREKVIWDHSTEGPWSQIKGYATKVVETDPLRNPFDQGSRRPNPVWHEFSKIMTGRILAFYGKQRSIPLEWWSSSKGRCKNLWTSIRKPVTSLLNTSKVNLGRFITKTEEEMTPGIEEALKKIDLVSDINKEKLGESLGPLINYATVVFILKFFEVCLSPEFEEIVGIFCLSSDESRIPLLCINFSPKTAFESEDETEEEGAPP